MIEIIDRPRDSFTDARSAFQIGKRRRPHLARGAEMQQQRALARRADAGNLVERAGADRAAAFLAVRADGEAVGFVAQALEDLGIEDVPLIGVAKGPHHGREGREVFHFPDGREKTLPVNSAVLFFVQRLRDEAHRFAIGAHRQKRSRAISASPLDEIPGIGPARKRALLLHFGTAGKVRAAALEDLKRAPGVSEAVAQAVYDFYHPSG